LITEFFGHKRGAFTGAFYDRKGKFELADRGTLLLDEIGDIGYELQTLLLRVLESGEVQRVGDDKIYKVNVRIISATNQDLHKLVSKKQFRVDLFHRISTFQIIIPPLRQHIEDIPNLSCYILNKFAERNNIPLKKCSEAAIKKLKSHTWPGNIRELENVLKRAAINAQSSIINDSDIIFDEFIETKFELDKPMQIYQSIISGKTDFWQAVKKPFLKRELSKDEVRSLLDIAYQHYGDNLKKILQAFRLPAKDYGRFVSFLHRNELR